MNPYIIINGQSSLADKLNAINKINVSSGRDQWKNALMKNSNIVSRSQKAVILNNRNASITFRFNLNGGDYNIYLRCIAPSTSADAGIVRIDSTRTRSLIVKHKTKATTYKQVDVALFSKMKLSAGPHTLTFSYREPMGLISLSVMNIKKTERIVVPAIDMLYGSGNQQPVQPAPLVIVPEVIKPVPVIEAQYATISPTPEVTPIYYVETSSPEPVLTTSPEPVLTTSPEPILTTSPEPVLTTSPEPETTTSGPYNPETTTTSGPYRIETSSSSIGPIPVKKPLSIKKEVSKKKKLPWYVILIIILIVFVVVGLFFWWLYKRQQQTTRNRDSSGAQTQTTLITLNGDSSGAQTQTLMNQNQKQLLEWATNKYTNDFKNHSKQEHIQLGLLIKALQSQSRSQQQKEFIASMLKCKTPNIQQAQLLKWAQQTSQKSNVGQAEKNQAKTLINALKTQSQKRSQQQKAFITRMLKCKQGVLIKDQLDQQDKQMDNAFVLTQQQTQTQQQKRTKLATDKLVQLNKEYNLNIVKTLGDSDDIRKQVSTFVNDKDIFDYIQKFDPKNPDSRGQNFKKIQNELKKFKPENYKNTLQILEKILKKTQKSPIAQGGQFERAINKAGGGDITSQNILKNIKQNKKN